MNKITKFLERFFYVKEKEIIKGFVIFLLLTIINMFSLFIYYIISEEVYTTPVELLITGVIYFLLLISAFFLFSKLGDNYLSIGGGLALINIILSNPKIDFLSIGLYFILFGLGINFAYIINGEIIKNKKKKNKK